ncbi:TonB-dependent receptor [Desulfonema ishimotonii]|uniref:TonB-dependent receptor n=2 Tax=Desulfonema ishimotonii TaxID=45657 RepID=A0A401FTC4_9BACT|nr:TonB-dependent receptor [Desulfonema ishimotonii]
MPLILPILCVWMILAFALPDRAGYPAAVPEPDIDFTQFSLEELKNVKIVSASKKPERISEVPAAVFVITRQDIRRSGATSIPEALRMAPGVQVARISATEWAVSMRDVNALFANKLLVLIDGRNIYTHVFSGVFWDMQDTLLEDIERIEVIRGPGAALWGVNAVNGVINIITRNARETQGNQFTALGGTEEGVGTLRHGNTIGENGHYRVYAKYFNRGKLFEGDKHILNDLSTSDWRSWRGGFRMDWAPEKEADTLMVQGEIFKNRFNSEETVFSDEAPHLVTGDETSNASGGHLLGRWQRTLSPASDMALRFYYDYYDKEFDRGQVRVHTTDLDVQHRFTPFERHEIIWGANWRFISDHFSETFEISTDPSDSDQHFYSAFVQDRIQLLPDRLNLTLGAKFEHNDDTGTEIQPSARLLWRPRPGHELWGAVSRAARVPSRLENDGVTRSLMASDERDTILRYMGNSALEAETLIAYEVGYRFQPTNTLWFSVAGFYHDYDDLITLEYRGTADENGNEVLLLEYGNSLDGESYGLELSAFWQVARTWQLQGAYTFLETRMQERVGEVDSDTEKLLFPESNPRNQVSLRSAWNMTRRLDLDLWFRYVDRLSENDVDEYVTLDARLAWTPIPSLELSVVGQNLLEPKHAEFSTLEIERSVYFKLDWCF